MNIFLKSNVAIENDVVIRSDLNKYGIFGFNLNGVKNRQEIEGEISSIINIAQDTYLSTTNVVDNKTQVIVVLTPIGVYPGEQEQERIEAVCNEMFVEMENFPCLRDDENVKPPKPYTPVDAIKDAINELKSENKQIIPGEVLNKAFNKYQIYHDKLIQSKYHKSYALCSRMELEALNITPFNHSISEVGKIIDNLLSNESKPTNQEEKKNEETSDKMNVQQPQVQQNQNQPQETGGIKVGKWVKIVSGPMSGNKGEVTAVNGNTVTVMVEGKGAVNVELSSVKRSRRTDTNETSADTKSAENKRKPRSSFGKAVKYKFVIETAVDGKKKRFMINTPLNSKEEAEEMAKKQIEALKVLYPDADQPKVEFYEVKSAENSLTFENGHPSVNGKISDIVNTFVSVLNTTPLPVLLNVMRPAITFANGSSKAEFLGQMTKALGGKMAKALLAAIIKK